ncbi:hypothetical protein [Kerstersia gyiorum]|uniref:hypothetical protein n=1 Tax=Kerstersia gyiorum TaxID=206506 RepID=UPI00209CA6C0|nr:hypothetical protein [Kerstersia gyiorum]MCP1680694.1 hypothetical protein [Kerstersia gyiorum]MCP1825228.1 hypothetical protein [Kerstersia gyiorum]MCP1828643.1 hypothetical protein [Kerstersia gyiorum]MCW2452269.1 hypothetical protein [Kerstersia gyiorum]
MKSAFCIITASIVFGGLAHAQMPPPILNQPQQAQAISSKKLENLLLCNPAQKFTRASAKDAFSELGLVEDKSGIYHPSNGKSAAVFGAEIADATISDESDEATLSVRVLDRTPDDIAKQLNIKKQRVNGPFGPETVFRKQTGKRSHIEIGPAASISPRAASIDCVIF